MPSSLQEAMLGDFLRIRWEDSDVGRKAISPDTEIQIVGDSQHMVGDWRVWECIIFVLFFSMKNTIFMLFHENCDKFLKNRQNV